MLDYTTFEYNFWNYGKKKGIRIWMPFIVRKIRF